MDGWVEHLSHGHADWGKCSTGLVPNTCAADPLPPPPSTFPHQLAACLLVLLGTPLVVARTLTAAPTAKSRAPARAAMVLVRPLPLDLPQTGAASLLPQCVGDAAACAAGVAVALHVLCCPHASNLAPSSLAAAPDASSIPIPRSAAPKTAGRSQMSLQDPNAARGTTLPPTEASTPGSVPVCPMASGITRTTPPNAALGRVMGLINIVCSRVKGATVPHHSRAATCGALHPMPAIPPSAEPYPFQTATHACTGLTLAPALHPSQCTLHALLKQPSVWILISGPLPLLVYHICCSRRRACTHAVCLAALLTQLR